MTPSPLLLLFTVLLPVVIAVECYPGSYSETYDACTCGNAFWGYDCDIPCDGCTVCQALDGVCLCVPTYTWGPNCTHLCPGTILGVSVCSGHGDCIGRGSSAAPWCNCSSAFNGTDCSYNLATRSVSRSNSISSSSTIGSLSLTATTATYSHVTNRGSDSRATTNSITGNRAVTSITQHGGSPAASQSIVTYDPSRTSTSLDTLRPLAASTTMLQSPTVPITFSWTTAAPPSMPTLPVECSPRRTPARYYHRFSGVPVPMLLKRVGPEGSFELMDAGWIVLAPLTTCVAVILVVILAW